MADEASFNLSAAISLQLAQGAGASLKTQVGKIKDIEVPVRFKDVSAAEQDKLIKKALKPIPIKVKFDRDSVQANLTEASLLAMMTVAQKNIVIPIKVQWDKDTAAKLKSVQSDIEKLTKYAEKLKKVSGVNNVNTAAAGNTSSVSKGTKAAIDGVDDLIAALKKLSKQSKDAKFGDVQKGKNFFQEAEAQIDRLTKKLKGLGVSSGISKLKEKFQGLGGDESARNNLLSSLKTLFKGLTDVKDAEEQVRAAGKNLGKSFNMTEALNGIQETRKSITSLFDSMASSDPNTFSISMISSVKKMQKSVGQSINTAGKDLRAFDTLLSSLNQKKAIAKDAKNPESVKNIGKLIQEVKDQYKSGSSVSEIKSSKRFQQLNALLGNLKYIEQGAKRAEIAMDNLTRKASKELKASRGGQLLGLDAKATFIGRQAGRDIRKTKDPAEIAKIVDIAKNEYNELAQRADKANKQFGRLEAQITKFEESDFTNAANSLKNYRAELDKLILAGTSIADIDNNVTRELAKAANLQGLDAKVNTAIKQIDRLRNALNFSPVEDLSGAKPALEQLESNLKSRTGKFAGLTPDTLNSETTKGLFDIRGMQRFNETADTTRTKLNNISDGFEDLSKVNVYSKYIRKFESGSRAIANSSDAVGVKLQKLRVLSDKVLIGSKLDAEGGFFGAIARSAGLATKRLAAFLILAQGLYGLQSVFSSTVSEAIKVDREFTKLEQVFNKGLSGNALKDQLKETKDQITDLAKTLGISTLEVAKSAQVLAQAGIEGRDLKILLDTISSSQLGPSFGDASETAEASIAIFRQFNLTAEGTKKALGGINQLSAQYAVEAKGITEAVRRAGGVFAASGDGIESFSAAFTLVKQKTREADESIATGLRNVAQRLQTSSVQKKLKEALGVNLIDNGEFVGFEESITRIGTALKGVSKQSSLFANVREIIGGQRQGGRVNPLLEDFGEFEKLKKAFRDGAGSIEKDAEVAFTSIENKLARAKAAFEQLIIEIQGSAFVKFLVEGFTQITQSVSNMLRVLNSVPGAIIAIGLAAKALGQGKIIQQAFLSNIIPRQSALKNKGGPIGFNGGGLSGIIPGGGPNKDSILAYLTTGEYVLKRKAVKKYGRTFLDNLNEGSINANKGGPIGRNSGGIIPGFAEGGFLGGVSNKIKSLIPKSIDKLFKSAFAPSQFKPDINVDFNYLERELNSFGFGIKNVTKYIKSITNQSEIKNATASFNPNTKTIGISGGGSSLLPHEVGHSLYENRSKKDKRRIEKTLTPEDIAATKKRLITDRDLYANPKTGKISLTTLKSEAVADKFDNLVSFKQQSFKKQRKNTKEFLGFNAFQTAIGGPQSAGGLTFNTTRKARRKSQSVIEAIRDQGAVGSANAPAPVTQPYFTRFSKNTSGGPLAGGGASGSAANAAKGVAGSAAGLSASFAALKGNSLQLISGFFILQSVLGTVSPAMAEMVSAMAAMAVSMYAFSQTGAAIGFAKNAAGAGAKSIATQKARSIAETFKAARPPVAGITDAARTSAKLAADLPVSIFARDARAVAQKSGTSSILANIRATDTGRSAKLAAQGVSIPSRSAAAIARGADAKNIGFFGNKLKGLSNFGGGAVKALGGKFTIGAIAAGALVGGLTYFAQAAEKSGKEALASAKTLEEAQDAGAKTRFAKAIQAPIKKLGASIGGALTGISIGLAVGGPFAPITAAVFGLTGAILPLISGIIPEGMSDIIKIGRDRIANNASRLFSSISDALFVISENIKNGDINYGGAVVGYLTSGIAGAIIGSNVAGGGTGIDELARQKARDEVIFRNNTTARGFGDKGNKSSGFYNPNGTQRTLREPEFKNLGAAGLLTQESIKREKQKVFDENKRLGRANPDKAEDIKFEDLSEEFQETQKQNLQGIIDTYKSLGPKNKGLLISFFQGVGLDIKDLTGQVGLEIDIATTALHSAMEKLTLFFAEIAQVVKFSSARLTTIESGFDFYSSGANQSLAPDKLFDVLKSGIDPSTIGGGVFNDAYANTNRLARQFDPRLAAAADYEIRGRRVAQNASSAIIAANPVIGTQDESQIGDFLESAFDAASGGDAELNKRFGKFLETKSAEDKKGLLDSDGKIDVVKLNELFTEFADSFELGALEEIRRLNELAKQYTTQYKTMMQERFELEAQANELRSGNVDREKLKDDIRNKAAGLTGDKLAEAEGQQARARDKKKLDLALGGVAGLQGLDPNSSADIAKLSAALLASQKRQEGAGAKALEEQGGVEGIEFGQARREAADAKTKRDAFAQSDAGKAEQAQRDAQKANISNKAKDLEKAITSGTPEEINKAQKELDNSLKQASDFNKNTTGFANEQKLTEAEKNLAQKEKDFAAKLPPSVESQNLNDAKLKTASAQKALDDYNNSAVGKQDNTDVQKAKDEVKKAEKELEAAKILAQGANGGPNQELADKTVASRQEVLDINNNTLALVTDRTGERRNPLTDSLNNAILNEQGAQTAFDNTLGTASGTASGAVQRQAEIEAQEAENQRRIKAGLAVAQSTDLAAHALKEFERAMDKMARSSEFLTNALLGTDEQLLSTVRGSVALGSVENAFQQGGTKAARAQFLSLNEEDRAGIQQRLGSDPDAKARFQEMLGFAPGGGAAPPQQTAAEEAIQRQIDASEGLATALDANAKTLITNMEKMKTLFDSQFTNAQTIVSQADKTAKELVDKIAALPGVIRHEANLTVNIIGADQMVLLQNGLREMMDKLIAQAINVNNNAIAGVNAGMNVP